MINWIMHKIGYVRCCICKRWTRPSIIYGAVCSFACLKMVKHSCKEVEQNDEK